MKRFKSLIIPHLFLVLALGISFCLTNSTEAQVVAKIEVDMGKSDRYDTPVSVEIPKEINAWRLLGVQEVHGSSRNPVPSQIEAGKKGQAHRLWFILSGKTQAGQKRQFELVSGKPFLETPIKLNLTPKSLKVSHGDAALFTYHHAHVLPPEGVKASYVRSGYITDMLSPGGKLITEDFPGDHYHHKGVWFPWTNTVFEGRDIDFWNLGKEKGRVQFAGFKTVESGPVFGRFKSKHEFVDVTQPNGGKIALNETWDVRIYSVGGREKRYYVWDLSSTQECATDSPLHLRKYRYGGMAFRGAKEWKGDNYVLLTSEGKTKANGHTTRAKWCAHSGAVDGQWTTVVIMCSPKNERFPEPMRIWARGGAFFNYTPIQHKAWDFKPGEKHQFSYRFYIHEGKIDKDRAEQAWQDFGNPPEVKLTLAK